MAARTTKRKLEVFSLHAHLQGRQIDYSTLFKDLATVPPDERMTADAEDIFAITNLDIDGDEVFIETIQGKRGVHPLIFNAQTSQERIQRLRSDEIVATKTHAMIDLRRREAVVEYIHAGAKAATIAQLLEHAGQTLAKWRGLSLDLNPKADEEFVKAIDGFGRIRLASLRVSRPNIAWTDHYSNLTKVAEASDAQVMEVQLSAGRSLSLNTGKGIVQFIRDLATKPLSYFKGAKITGTREGEGAETTITLANYITHQRVKVRLNRDGHVESDAIRGRMKAYLGDRRKGKSKNG